MFVAQPQLKGSENRKVMLQVSIVITRRNPLTRENTRQGRNDSPLCHRY